MATVFMMTARMCTIAAVCVGLLCLMLFAVGVQVGLRLDARVAGEGEGARAVGGTRGAGAAGETANRAPSEAPSGPTPPLPALPPAMSAPAGADER